MRVIAQDDAGIDRDALHAPGDLRRGRQALGDHLRRHIEADGTGRHAQGVRDVEPAEQRQRHRMTPLCRDEREPRAFRVDAHVPRRHVRGVRGRREGDASRRTWQPRPGGVIDVDHRQPGIRQVPHQLGLGCEIGVERLVIIEMVAREIREDGGAEHQPFHPPLIETVRGNFHRDAAGAALEQRREGGLQIDRTGRREIARLALDRRPRRIERAQRADRPHRPKRTQHVPRQNDGRRLAVRAGHTDQLQSRRRLPIPGLGGDRGRTPTVPHQNLRNRGGDGRGLAQLDEHGGGAPRHRIGHERVTVEHRAAHGAEQHAGLEPARVGSEPGDVGHWRSSLRCLDQSAGARQRIHNLLQRSTHGREMELGGSSPNTVTVVPAAAPAPAAGQV